MVQFQYTFIALEGLLTWAPVGNNFKKLEDGAFVEFLLLLVFIDFAHFQSSRGQPLPHSVGLFCVFVIQLHSSASA